MAKNNVTTFVFRGKTSYAKVLGDPVLNYAKDGKEWKFDFLPFDPKGVKKELTSVGVGDRLRTKDEYLDGAPFLTFKQKELREDGTPNDPIKVVDAAGKIWPEDKLIGNGSVVDVKFVVVDFGKGKFKGMYPRSIRVLEHVPYEVKEFDDLDENDEFYKAALAAEKEAEARKAAEDKQFKEDFGLSVGDSDDGSLVAADEELNDEIPV